MEEATVLVANAGPVRTLTLNRPKALNSFTAAMHGELLAALDAAAAEGSVRCLVVTGSGRGFCAGQDLADPSVAPTTFSTVATNVAARSDRRPTNGGVYDNFAKKTRHRY